MTLSAECVMEFKAVFRDVYFQSIFHIKRVESGSWISLNFRNFALVGCTMCINCILGLLALFDVLWLGHDKLNILRHFIIFRVKSNQGLFVER